jgi:hypothetical protein
MTYRPVATFETLPNNSLNFCGDSLDVGNCMKQKRIRKVLQVGRDSRREYSIKIIILVSSGFILLLSVVGNIGSSKNVLCIT